MENRDLSVNGASRQAKSVGTAFAAAKSSLDTFNHGACLPAMGRAAAAGAAAGGDSRARKRLGRKWCVAVAVVAKNEGRQKRRSVMVGTETDGSSVVEDNEVAD